MDKLSFLNEPEEVETPEETVMEAPEAEAPPIQEPEPEAVQPAPVVEEPKQEQHVPLPTFLDMRDKLKEAERKAKELEQRLTQPVEPLPVPDVFEDPQGFQTHIAQTFEDRLYQQTLAISRRFAEQQHGKETTDTAVNWGVERCNSDPYFNAQVRSSPDPVGFVVEQFNRDRIASSVNLTEYEQFQAWKAAQAQVTQAQATPAPSQAIPTPSMASVPSAGGVDHVPVGPGQAFDSLFQK